MQSFPNYMYRMHQRHHLEKNDLIIVKYDVQYCHDTQILETSRFNLMTAWTLTFHENDIQV